ncbi:hypothetical protein [Streptomyces poonensis]|uniref:Uncharacterized protein n=1 Tax=Streptomyces poonensis TaxID=68255 RepID=A0A918Q7P3_9ACTN|nr:hypothetical protein [Streptomyces poonensis]GGZ37042.1 hypothetical protein GCM10010365_67360 [Streptomyces poonensis]GLJ90137.1 hypothetical protein GCM10017589_27380 [Streptomyces poonensis]
MSNIGSLTEALDGTSGPLVLDALADAGTAPDAGTGGSSPG